MTTWPLQAKALTETLAQVAFLLREFKAYWQLQPMGQTTLPFSSALNNQLAKLDIADLTALEQNPLLQQHYFADFFPDIFTLPLGLNDPDLEGLPSWPFWLTNGIGGRKLSQIQAFCQHLPNTSLPVLEWCAGKGHLGRLLAAKGRQVTSVEWQASLCQAGDRLAKQFMLPQQFVCADVLSQVGPALLKPAQQVIALHACGDLHLALLHQAVAKDCAAIQLTPCCYHLTSQQDYQPLSEWAKQKGLALTRQDLKLAVQGQVTAGDRITRLRQTEVTWRLAFDLVRAKVTGEAKYTPLPSLPKAWFSGDLASFLAHGAALQHFSLPANIDYADLLVQADQAYLRVMRIDAVRHVFRRPLELYLVLDRAQYLQEQGYEVQVKVLCDYSTTPRNFVIQARLATPTSA